MLTLDSIANSNQAGCPWRQYLVAPRDKYMRSFSQVLFIAGPRSEFEATLDMTPCSNGPFCTYSPTSRFSQSLWSGSPHQLRATCKAMVAHWPVIVTFLAWEKETTCLILGFENGSGPWKRDLKMSRVWLWGKQRQQWRCRMRKKRSGHVERRPRWRERSVRDGEEEARRKCESVSV